MTNLELSEKIGLSPTPCLRRVKRLEEEGVIHGYAAIVDQKAYGLPLSVFVSVRLSQQSEEQIKEFEKAVARLERSHRMPSDDRRARLSAACLCRRHRRL